MTIYVTIPGTKRQPVIIPDNSTLADLSRQVFHLTGCTNFKGFGLKTQSGATINDSQSPVTNANVFDLTSNETVSLEDVPYTTLVSSLFTEGDEIFILNTAIGG